MTYRTPTLLLTLIALAALSLAGCKTGSGTPSPVIEKLETYHLEITDNSAFNAKEHLAQRVDKELSDDGWTATDSRQSAKWPMRLLLTYGTVQQLDHSDLGSAPIPVPMDPISVLINACYFLGWSAKEVGKQAVNAGTPNYLIHMRLHVLDPEGTVWRIEDEIPLYTLDNEKSREHIAREGADKIAGYLDAFRAGEKIENAVEETNAYELEQFHAASN
ncbi:hypothetical protein BerOc1_00509 [Pseudodesulfovibrio hydrargyri]|uniref:Lipoprotein n=1 Tax=Pseudodesulfovibrio hydrargyri TaxID=2125990 RepID=A0A1J5MZP8_9BACT|nr:hypothetical protein [Pseudodesulfovibrio hydrargyri]OIQ52037.1 hypothetical protein BerOc1_00509 [Pseudodesulfovibrio hydrargyri]